MVDTKLVEYIIKETELSEKDVKRIIRLLEHHAVVNLVDLIHEVDGLIDDYKESKK